MIVGVFLSLLVVFFLALVFFAAVFGVMALGSKLASFFTTDSSVARKANNKVSVISSADAQKYNADYETKAADTTTILTQFNTLQVFMQTARNLLCTRLS